MVLVNVESLVIGLLPMPSVITLRVAEHREDIADDLVLPIWIGTMEATAIAAALEGYIVTRAPWWQRILLAAGGLCLIDPSLMTDIVGVAAIVIVVVLQIVMRKRSKPVAA